jgi:uncharacterized protein YkwD
VTPFTRLLRAIASVAVLASSLVISAIVDAPTASAAGTVNEGMELEFANLLNQSRAASGLPALPFSVSIRDVARSWSGTMVANGSLSHNPTLAGQIGNIDPRWQAIGENVGVGYTVSSLHEALMNSTGHRANILGNWTYVSIGVVTSGDKLWLTQNFIRTPTPHTVVGTAPTPSNESVWLTRNTPSGGNPDKSIPYGLSSYQQLSCDWDGNGTETLGVYTNNTFYLRNENSAGSPDISVSYGWAGVTPVCGDWNGDGVDTIGIYSAGQWLLRDSNAPGAPHYNFAYGWGGANPVVGDWNGNGTDGIGVYAGGSWYLRDAASPGAARVATSYGYQGALPVVGDWDGSGADSIGVYDRGAWYLRQDTSGGRPQVAFNYGWSATRPVTGDWNGDAITGVGVIPR